MPILFTLIHYLQEIYNIFLWPVRPLSSASFSIVFYFFVNKFYLDQTLGASGCGDNGRRCFMFSYKIKLIKLFYVDFFIYRYIAKFFWIFTTLLEYLILFSLTKKYKLFGRSVLSNARVKQRIIPND